MARYFPLLAKIYLWQGDGNAGISLLHRYIYNTAQISHLRNSKVPTKLTNAVYNQLYFVMKAGVGYALSVHFSKSKLCGLGHLSF